MVKNLNILTILFILWIITGCGEDNNLINPPISSENILFLKRSQTETDFYTISREYFYEGDQLKTKVSNYFKKDDSGIEIVYRDEYVYTNNESYKRISYDNDELSSSAAYYRVNENIVRTDIFYANGDLRYYRLFYLSGNPCGSTQAEFYDSNGVLTGSDNTTFLDQNCSFQRASFDSLGIQVAKTDYIMDNKNYIYHQSINLYKMDLSKLHNIKEVKRWDENNIINERSSYKSIFEYNIGDYPISERRVYLDGRVDNYTYEYI